MVRYWIIPLQLQVARIKNHTFYSYTPEAALISKLPWILPLLEWYSFTLTLLKLGFDFHTRSGKGQVSHMVKVNGHTLKSSLPTFRYVKFNHRNGTCDGFPVQWHQFQLNRTRGSWDMPIWSLEVKRYLSKRSKNHKVIYPWPLTQFL